MPCSTCFPVFCLLLLVGFLCVFSLFPFCSMFFCSWVSLATFSVGIAVIPWEACLGFAGLSLSGVHI
jgi:hypothetical protein